MKSRLTMASLLLAIGVVLMSSAYATVVVRMDVAWGTTGGNIDILLRDDLPWDTFTADANHSAANPVDNFLSYVNSGAYTNTYFHRQYTTGSSSIIQAGGFTWTTTDPQGPNTIATGLPIYYQSKMPNAVGTIAMARTNDPNSATSGWFINVTDNTTLWADGTNCVFSPPTPVSSSITDCGYTAFGTVFSGMDLVDQINALPTVNCGGNYASLPLFNYSSCDPLAENLALVKSISILNTVSVVQGASGNFTIISFESPVTVSTFDAVASQPPPPPTTDSIYSNFIATQFDEGYFNIQLANVPAGVPETVTMTLPSGSFPNTFYRYGPTPDNSAPHWYDFMWDGQTGAKMTLGSNIIQLVFVDGQRGDDDLTQDGEVGVSIAAPGANPLIGSSASAISPLGTSGKSTVISVLSPAIVLSTFMGATTLPSATPPSEFLSTYFSGGYSEGFFNFSLANVPAATPVVLTMTLPIGVNPNSFYKYGPTPDNPVAHWYGFMWNGQTGALMTPGSNVIQLVFVDGQTGDDDLAQDGEIHSSFGGPGANPLKGPSTYTTGASGNFATLGLQSNLDDVTKFLPAANPSPGDAPAGVTFGEGFFDIELNAGGNTTAVVLTLPKDQQPNTYYKYGPTPDDPADHWYEFMWDGTTGAIIGDGRGAPKNTIALVFVDGERGDDDLTVNGVITDVGAPGVKVASGGGGGAVDIWSLLVLLCVSGWFSAQGRRH